MKKLIAIILAALTLFALVSCGGNEGNETTTTTDPASTSTPAAEIIFTDCDENLFVYSKNGAVNIRTSPEVKEGNLVEGLENGLASGTAVRRIGYHAEWSKIIYNGETCYVKTSLLVEELPIEITDDQFIPVENKLVYAYYDNNEDGECDTDAQINLRTAPSFEASSVKVLTCGTELTLIGIYVENAETGAGWSKVVYNGETYYTRNSCISEVKPHTEAPAPDTAA